MLKMKKEILLITMVFSLLFFSFLVSAECSIPTVKQGDTIQLTQSCTDCPDGVNVTKVIFPNNTIAQLGQFEMSANGSNYNLSFSNTDTLGTHIYYSEGNLSSVVISQSCSFEVTQTGFLLKTSESILYIILILATFTLFLGFLYPAITLPYSNKVEPDGSIRRIMKAKYFKLLAIWFAYGFLMWFLQTLDAITKSFISLDYLSNFITNIFTYSQLFSVIVTFVILTILFIEAWKDILLSETIKRYGKALVKGDLR